MPIYEYKCENGHLFETTQRMSADPLTACEVCEAPVKRVFHPVAVHFKGSGFYNTDYGTRKRSREAKENSSTDGASKSESSNSKDASPSSKDASSSSSEGKKSESSAASPAASD